MVVLLWARYAFLLLISALMIVPIATAQLLAGSFRATVVLGTLIGVTVSLAGVTTSFYSDTPSGGTIVLFAIALFLLAAGGTSIRDRIRRRSPAPAPAPA